MVDKLDTLDAVSLHLLDKTEQKIVTDLFNHCLEACRCDVLKIDKMPTQEDIATLELKVPYAYVCSDETLFYVDKKQATIIALAPQQGVGDQAYQHFLTSLKAKLQYGSSMPLTQRELAQFTALTGHVHEHRPETRWTSLAPEEQRQWLERLSSPLLQNYFETLLEQLDGDARRGMFHYYSKTQRRVYEEALLLAFRLFTSLYILDETTEQHLMIEKRKAQLNRCAFVIEALRSDPLATKAEAHHALLSTLSPEKPVAYCGLRLIGPFISEKIHDFRMAKASMLVDWMSEINMRRLYWIWGGGLVGAVIEALSDDFTTKTQARNALSIPSPVTGYMSWILYYSRFSINLMLLLKHTFRGPWMSQEEKALPISTWERFSTQWQLRKFTLLNDSIWATANLVCFFWLVGNGMMGYWGNALTSVLLLMDVSLTVWRFCEDRTHHRQEMKRYNNEINALLSRQAICSSEHRATEREPGLEDSNVLDEEERRVLSLQLHELQSAREQCQFEWKHKKYSTINDLCYAIGLLASFCVVCCFFFPPASLAAGTSLILGLTGAALCFSMSLLYASIGGALDIEKSKETKTLTQARLESYLQIFKLTDNSNEKRQYYLDMKRLLATSDYQERLIRFQKMKLARNILLDAMIPVVVFVTLIFLPMGIGLSVLAATMVLALLSNKLLKCYEPKMATIPGLDEAIYEHFEHEPSIERLRGGVGVIRREHSDEVSSSSPASSRSSPCVGAA